MTQTVNVLSSFEVAQRADHLAQGHLLAFGLPFASGEEQGYLGGSAGVITTVADMAHYLIMHNNGGRFADAAHPLPGERGDDAHAAPHRRQRLRHGLGWAHTVDNRRVLEHNGILSTFYAETVLLPDTGQGFVLLYNIHSLDQDLLGYPPIKQGLLRPAHRRAAGERRRLQCRPRKPAHRRHCGSKRSVRAARLVAAAALAGAGRSPPVVAPHVDPRLSLHPPALLLAFPAIVLSTSDRAFGYLTLFRSMVGVMTWLELSALLGVINGLARAAWLLRRR